MYEIRRADPSKNYHSAPIVAEAESLQDALKAVEVLRAEEHIPLKELGVFDTEKSRWVYLPRVLS